MVSISSGLCDQCLIEDNLVQARFLRSFNNPRRRGFVVNIDLCHNHKDNKYSAEDAWKLHRKTHRKVTFVGTMVWDN